MSAAQSAGKSICWICCLEIKRDSSRSFPNKRSEIIQKQMFEILKFISSSNQTVKPAKGTPIDGFTNLIDRASETCLTGSINA